MALSVLMASRAASQTQVQSVAARAPLALAVIGGLALSTPITLFVVPTLLVALRGRDYQLPSKSAEPQEIPS